MSALAAASLRSGRRAGTTGVVGLPRWLLLLAGLAAAVALRYAINGASVASALVAGLAFGVLLLLMSRGRALRELRRPPLVAIGLGLCGGITLVGVPLLIHPVQPLGLRPEPLLAWALVTCVVAAGEEAMLRGALFDALREAGGLVAAIVLTTVAFALMHVPLYGWSVVPIDVGAGLVLCGLRLAGQGVAAPAIAHALADLGTWWL
jgi:membrane protease YdiL (CAAX protease family)